MNAVCITICLLTLSAGAGLCAQEESQGTIGLRGALMGYSDASSRERLTSGGVFLDLDQRDTGGLRLSVDRDAIRYRDSSELDQDSVLGGLRFYLPLGGAGKLIFQGDFQRVGFQATGTAKQNVNVTGLHVGYLSDLHPEVARFHLDLGLIQSKYDGGLKAEQLSPTVGFGLNGNMDWFTLGLDAITVKQLGAEDIKTSAVRGSWSHYFVPGSPLKPKNIYLTGLGGERLFAADMDLALVYTLADYQTARWSLGSTWGGVKGFGFTLEAGGSRFENRSDAGTVAYTTQFVAASIHYTW